MKAYKVVLLIVDHDDVGPAGIVRTIESANYPNDCISPSAMSIDVADIGKWHDGHPLNRRDTHAAEFDRLFGSKS